MNLFRLIILVVTISLNSAIANAQDRVEFQMPKRGICAHRGASVSHPENTIAAFEEAIRLGAHMIELDLALTKDDAIVVLHDTTLDRTTNGKGSVKDWTLADLKKLDAGSFKAATFKDQTIPTFREALAVMPENVWLNVHLKGDAKLATAATRVIIEQDRLHQCFLACGINAARAAKTVDKRIKICNMERQGNNLLYVKESIAGKADFLQLYGGTEVDPSHTKLARTNGLQINYCCTNDANVLKHLFKAGVQFPLVDDLQTMMDVAIADGIQPLRPVYRARDTFANVLTPTSLLIERVALEKGVATQGLAVSEEHFFASNAGSIVRYSKDWIFIEEKRIRLPGVNHIGAIDYYDGNLWAGFLNGPENGAYDSANDKGIIAKISAETLEVVATWDITTKLTWIDPVCFDGTHLWVGDLRDLGIHRYRIDGDKITHTGTLRYPRELHFSQGIRIKGDRMYSIHTFGSMDGLFELTIPKTLTDTPVTPNKVWKIPELFTHAEGFEFVSGTDNEIWHAQSGKVERIRLND